jgi:hypothetical protein
MGDLVGNPGAQSGELQSLKNMTSGGHRLLLG